MNGCRLEIYFVYLSVQFSYLCIHEINIKKVFRETRTTEPGRVSANMYTKPWSHVLNLLELSKYFVFNTFKFFPCPPLFSYN